MVHCTEARYALKKTCLYLSMKCIPNNVPVYSTVLAVLGKCNSLVFTCLPSQQRYVVKCHQPLRQKDKTLTLINKMSRFPSQYTCTCRVIFLLPWLQ